MYSILPALVMVKRHFLESNKIDAYKKIYRELQNLNLMDENSIEQAIELIKMLLSDDIHLTKMLIHLINQSKAATSGKTIVIAGDLSCHKPPDLSNLGQKILKAVHKILPKSQIENSVNQSHVLAFPPTNDKSVSCQNGPITRVIPVQDTSASNSSLIFTLNKNTSISVSASCVGSTINTSSNVFKLMPVGKAIHPISKNLTVVPLYDNLLELHSYLQNRHTDARVSKNVENPLSSSTHLYTINNTKLACLSSNDKHAPASIPTPTSIAAGSSNHISSQRSPNTSQLNAIQTLLSAAQMVDKMSTSKNKVVTQQHSGIPVNVLRGVKSPAESNSTLSSNADSSRNIQVRTSNVRSESLDALQKVLPVTHEPLDFSIPKGNKFESPQNKSDSVLQPCKGDKDEEEDDEDALIIVDDDEKCSIAEKDDEGDCKVELEEIVLKTEPSRQEGSSFLTELIGQSSDFDQASSVVNRRKRKRSTFLPSD